MRPTRSRPKAELQLVFLAIVASNAFLAAQGPPAHLPPFTQEEIQARRDALRARIFEPVVLEAQSFRLAFERATSSFVIEDRRTGIGWHSRLEEKGFATVTLLPEGRVLPIDRAEEVVAGEKEIRFRGLSSQGALPEIRFTIRVLDPLVGLEIAYEILGDAEQVERVRLIDRGLFVADADGGGALLPARFGERLEPTTPATTRVFSVDTGPWSPETVTPERAHLPYFGLVRSEARDPTPMDAALLGAWESDGARLEFRADTISSPLFPGRRGIVTTVSTYGKQGAVRLFPLGKGDAIEIAQSLRQLIQRERDAPTLRFKTEQREELSPIFGAAVFKPGLQPVAELEALATRFREKLGIDHAVLFGPPGAGGEDLERLSTRVRALGWLFGVEMPAVQLRDSLPDLLAKLAPRVVLIEAAASADDSARIAKLLGAKQVIAGTRSAGGSSAVDHGWLEGVLSADVLLPIGHPRFPLYAFATGHLARMTVRASDALEPDQTDRALAHLRLGEVPLYALAKPGADEPNASDEDPRFPLARCDRGWAAGQGLSVRERFVKNTFEVLSQVARIRFRAPLLFHRFLDAERLVEEIYFGTDMKIVINQSPKEWSDPEGNYTLPTGGFWIQNPYFHAFYATRAHDVDYPGGALFTVLSLEGKMYLRAEAVRIYHGFGDPRIRLGGRDFTVQREQVVKIW